MAELRRLQGLVAEVDAELTKYKENDPEAHKHMCELLVGRGWDREEGGAEGAMSCGCRAVRARGRRSRL